MLTHITTSVGWLGAVLAYLALDITATTGQDVETVRAAYVAMGIMTSYVIVPLALASVLIGVVNALGTPWGLFRHYWVLVKLLLTAFAATVLLIEVSAVRHLADAATSAVDPRELPGTLLHSVGGSVVLLLVMVLSVYKPRGVTRYGWRRQQAQRREQRPTPVR
ncbi:membrane protein [Saccharothrix sp. NRRL B-16348]|nr:membrane protein [Saccharothrix sp. NRRL B-16348]